MTKRRFRAGQDVEVLVPDIDAKRGGVMPHWQTATFVDITVLGHIRVKMPGRNGIRALRAFSPDDVRAPQPTEKK